MDEYANLKTPHLVNCSSISTSDAQLFMKFGKVISQNIGVFKKSESDNPKFQIWIRM
ncbi:putative non-specific serine/threonine protein kinase [Helianthus annuus]|uniref:Non-specific serine/threonine protein kinase n=1 Tax=Helianthus annuus TaxID=4232 RepID=A0A9K3H9T2_HELAN|nr:putative non-specific serine/threonine protein kinase [Helianthus annuus]KAJ0476547.1 putative non-specific serine/threonine protein kinase [Helianthus annuus]KAJ0497377.1 putative non-specific serine/threonine protein kinase [Helianthus annuus]KAJ0663391.1 putative non-specific serine/threonine protein kinase [Helianthus annuus]KAJ0670889.1 putative non-specific serine/threonine protein kinase [Helianthus annuus]